jgi:Ras-related protein Rab-1A
MAVRGKVILVGDAGVGKTSLIQSYQTNFTNSYLPTVGALSYHLMIDGVSLNIWDTAGQEHYRSLVPVYLRGAEVAFLVFDLSSPETFDHLGDWLLMLDEIESCRVIVVGNKSDLTPHRIPPETVNDFVRDHGGRQYLSVSAKLQNGIDLLFSAAADVVKSNENSTSKANIQMRGPEQVVIDAQPIQKPCC